jgi:hypothetical protein
MQSFLAAIYNKCLLDMAHFTKRSRDRHGSPPRPPLLLLIFIQNDSHPLSSILHPYQNTFKKIRQQRKHFLFFANPYPNTTFLFLEILVFNSSAMFLLHYIEREYFICPKLFKNCQPQLLDYTY